MISLNDDSRSGIYFGLSLPLSVILRYNLISTPLASARALQCPHVELKLWTAAYNLFVMASYLRFNSFFSLIALGDNKIVPYFFNDLSLFTGLLLYWFFD